jgi:hypothetical protein
LPFKPPRHPRNESLRDEAVWPNDEDVHNYQSFEFSFIALDESTQDPVPPQPLAHDRPLPATPNAAGAPILGAPGHDFHLKVFLGACPHCHPDSDKARKPFELYTDACWSDGSPLSTRGDDGVRHIKTTQFVPGSVSDHSYSARGMRLTKQTCAYSGPRPPRPCWRAAGASSRASTSHA